MQQILELRQIGDPTDLIRTGMILALYETYDSPPDQTKAWQIHVEAACNLMWQSHLPAGALNVHDLRRLCTIELLEILFKAITLLWDFRQKKDVDDLDWTSADEMLIMSMNIERRLLHWYNKLVLENDHPLFMTRAGPASSTLINTHDQPQAIIFSDISSIHLILFYWLGLVIVYTSMFEALETIAQSSQSQLPKDFNEKMKLADSLCHKSVTYISQSQADATTAKGLGTAIFATATSVASQNISRGWKRNDYIAVA
ncbi:uncharacterized protein N7484_004377 [Penicillium longicatenatum]|uniref:uncharacterized protein n=1 Tax=Penicillium longicatenatum TaxID=1561947 RepID=UPI002548BED0|nr:uncharacterized protein N7484_004377 [Penicillium longicatenatum]KAJ5650654.1 hypothetical protein N7484_004377 [Penicillium longicatenatum]